MQKANMIAKRKAQPTLGFHIHAAVSGYFFWTQPRHGRNAPKICCVFGKISAARRHPMTNTTSSASKSFSAVFLVKNIPDKIRLASAIEDARKKTQATAMQINVKAQAGKTDHLHRWTPKIGPLAKR